MKPSARQRQHRGERKRARRRARKAKAPPILTSFCLKCGFKTPTLDVQAHDTRSLVRCASCGSVKG